MKNIQALLKQPIDRVDAYVNHLQKIHENTQKDHPDYGNVSASIESFFLIRGEFIDAQNRYFTVVQVLFRKRSVKKSNYKL